MSYALNRYPGLGNIGQDIQTAIQVTAGLFRDPDGTLRTYGPPIVAAADRHVISPVVNELGKAVAPYLLKYALPAIAGLYVITGVTLYYSYQNNRRMRANRRRR